MLLAQIYICSSYTLLPKDKAGNAFLGIHSHILQKIHTNSRYASLFLRDLDYIKSELSYKSSGNKWRGRILRNGILLHGLPDIKQISIILERAVTPYRDGATKGDSEAYVSSRLVKTGCWKIKQERYRAQNRFESCLLSEETPMKRIKWKNERYAVFNSYLGVIFALKTGHREHTIEDRAHSSYQRTIAYQSYIHFTFCASPLTARSWQRSRKSVIIAKLMFAASWEAQKRMLG